MTAMPRTQRGAAAAYGPLPWHMAGSALALWFRLEDRDEARRHVVPAFDLDDDPVVGARFWDLVHDAGRGDEAVAGNPGAARMREASIAFAVSYAGIKADNTAHMYADDPTYVAFAREAMGWPVVDGRIHLSPLWPPGAAPGVCLRGVLERQGHTLMQAAVTLVRPLDEAEAPSAAPTWLTEKLIPDVTVGPPAVHQIVRTGASRVRWGTVWEATGELSFGPGPADELEHLRPREIVRAQYWSDIELWIGPGEVLTDFRVSRG